MYIFVYSGEVDPSDLGHLGAGKFLGDFYALDIETGEWKKLDDRSKSGNDHPGPCGDVRLLPGHWNGQLG
ncbi:hypothetical protein Acr_12g0002310 [Actinidia rufa]|uniref:Galactose oxidase/kelch repeat superfamily protein n=1 Tax=Actinidia rufa TaxID=165716 RepID=A0A7J0FG61_9ERIC|nr:hypothetical protein Acr_12g0002310 [Actinidia rufa]